MKRKAETYTLVWQFIDSVSQTKVTTYCHTRRRICLTFCKKRLQTDALSALLAGGGLHRGFKCVCQRFYFVDNIALVRLESHLAAI